MLQFEMHAWKRHLVHPESPKFPVSNQAMRICHELLAQKGEFDHHKFPQLQGRLMLKKDNRELEEIFQPPLVLVGIGLHLFAPWSLYS